MCGDNCTIAYLHVVDYNKSAINFYIKKNGFEMLKVEKAHYVIFNKEYDAIVLYKKLQFAPLDGEK
jgi:hypothetical protein